MAGTPGIAPDFRCLIIPDGRGTILLLERERGDPMGILRLPLARLALAALLTALLLAVVPTTASSNFTLVRSYDGIVSGGEFGYACVVIGDMDGDGIPEFAIGAPGDNTGGDNAGRVFIYRGAHPLGDSAAWVITGAPGERLGHS